MLFIVLCDINLNIPDFDKISSLKMSPHTIGHYDSSFTFSDQMMVVKKLISGPMCEENCISRGDICSSSLEHR